MTGPGSYTTETRDMYAVHRALSACFEAAGPLVGAAGDDPAKVATVASFYENVVELLRVHHEGEDELVFAAAAGSFLDGSALRRRYKSALQRAELRPLRFHDLRHTFGTRMIAKADIRRVQEWMGHADIQTTMRYLHYAPRAEDARLVAEAFQVEAAAEA